MIEGILSEPAPAVIADLETIQPGDLPKTLKICRTIQQPGRMDGFCAYFDAWFDDEISLSTEPPNTTLHWRIPVFRTPAALVKAGDQVEFHLEMKDIADPKSYRWTCTHIPASESASARVA